MKKYIYDEKNGLHYELVGDYYLPCLEAPQAPQIGIWGQRRRRYLREHQKARYTAMMFSDMLNPHLEEVDRTATEMYDRLISQMAKQEGISEQMKAQDQMAWVGAMNNIRNRAADVVWKELICV